jgi:hypothetical protein
MTIAQNRLTNALHRRAPASIDEGGPRIMAAEHRSFISSLSLA